MPLRPDSSVGAFKILEPLGAGGMGEVYRARDTRLQRDVAIKVLPSAVAADPEYLARFDREAKLLGSLSHPNIATLHGLEASGEARLLVMELVPGETLGERLARGPLSVPETLEVFKQVAEALESAHDHGVVHRDLKPANIKVTPDGVVKVLDFGLAKAVDEEPAGGDLSRSPTLTHETRAGVVLGTASYMSPEQARGKRVDKRTDVWAFGCTLYEALTGGKAFPGETASDVIGAVLRGEPDWAALPEATPPRLRELLGRCLRKDARQRLRDLGDARLEIEALLAGDGATTPVVHRRRGRAAIWLAGGFLAGAATGAVVLGSRTPSSAPPAVVRLRLSFDPAEHLGWLPGLDLLDRPSRSAFALSADGRRLVFTGMKDGRPQLYVRNLDQERATAISGTEGAAGPFLSPDGTWVGFWSAGALRKVAVDGGPAVVLCETPLPDGASWGDDDQIVFAQGGLSAVPAEGGRPRILTTPVADRGEVSHRLPHLLPGGDAVLFTVKKSVIWGWDRAEVVVQGLAGGDRRVLVPGGADARYLPTGHLVYANGGTLMAVAFDLPRRELAGAPVPLLEGVMHAQNGDNPQVDSGAAQFSVSAAGTLVYASGGVYPEIESSMVVMDRSGRIQPLPAPPRPYLGPRLSPDGRSVAVQAKSTLWRYEMSRDAMVRLQGDAGFPTWSPDGSQIVFTTPGGLRRVAADGGDPETLTVTTGTTLHLPMSISPDGARLAYVEWRPGSKHDVWELPLAGGESRPLVQSAFDENHPQFSPDGRWLAYASDESGREEVYVRPASGRGGTYPASTGGGTTPLWARSGRELFYRQGSLLMAVDVRPGPQPSFGSPRPILEMPARPASVYTRDYDVTSDDRRFLMLRERETPSAAVGHAEVVLGWFEELRSRAPRGQR
jgi:serine/threonine-protein kinase